MIATGIIRRVDDLGRIVIPREVRKRLGITEGTPMELFITEDKDGITFIKYDSYSELNNYIDTIREIVTENEIDNSEKILEHLKSINKILQNNFKEN